MSSGPARRRRVLVCNDDGVFAPGLCALAGAVAADGHDVFVVAPDNDMTASGTSAGGREADKTVHYRPIELSGLPGVPAFAVPGPPGRAVMAACRSGFGQPPDHVVVGINDGLNTGGRVVYSGTVGAAVIAASYGVSGVAVSQEASSAPSWDLAARAALVALDWLIRFRPAPPIVLNINVPGRRGADLQGVRPARLAAVSEGRAFLVETAPGVLNRHTVASGHTLPPDSDLALVRAGYITITPIRYGEPEGYLTPALRELADEATLRLVEPPAFIAATPSDKAMPPGVR